MIALQLVFHEHTEVPRNVLQLGFHEHTLVPSKLIFKEIQVAKLSSSSSVKLFFSS